MGENPKVTWAEFSTLSWAVFVMSVIALAYICTHTSKVENSAQILAS
jgi:hypothetical protein